jgi:hypothetical protein
MKKTVLSFTITEYVVSIMYPQCDPTCVFWPNMRLWEYQLVKQAVQ